VTAALFDSAQQIKPDVWLLPNAVNSQELIHDIALLAAASPFRHLQVASGQNMSVAMTNCGSLGWYSDRAGYRYQATDPLSLPMAGQAWPAMPPSWSQKASDLAALAGWSEFKPDACLINRYEAGARMGLHQDRDERDFGHPIVSVSLGASCQFLIGGLKRTDPVQKIALHSGDVVVWGASARLMFHGVAPVKVSGNAPLRYNLTFRKAG
jgi:DNA oxidative demethylase